MRKGIEKETDKGMRKRKYHKVDEKWKDSK